MADREFYPIKAYIYICNICQVNRFQYKDVEDIVTSISEETLEHLILGRNNCEPGKLKEAYEKSGIEGLKRHIINYDGRGSLA